MRTKLSSCTEPSLRESESQLTGFFMVAFTHATFLRLLSYSVEFVEAVPLRKIYQPALLHKNRAV